MFKKNNIYSNKISTEIWHDDSVDDNPYAINVSRLHGYNILDLVNKVSFVDTLYLLFTSQLPNPDQSQLLEKLMVFLINPGPRHNATRSAMSAGVSKADHSHILPIGLIAMGGEHLGSAEVEKAIHFFNQHIDSNPQEIGVKLFDEKAFEQAGDYHIAPGFGSRFNSVDNIAIEMAQYLCKLPGAGKSLRWGNDFATEINKYDLNWLNTGIAAAVFNDLGIGAREGAGLFQLMSAPGLLAHGLEQTHKPITAMPMLEDEDYVIE